MTFDHVFADLGGVPASRLTDTQALARRGLEVVIKRLGARETRTDTRRRGPVTPGVSVEGS